MNSVLRYLAPLLPDAQVIQDRINHGVRGSHKTDVRVWITDYDTAAWRLHPLVDPTGWLEADFEVITGTVTEHMEKAVSRELNLTIASEYWQDPSDVLQQLSPYRVLIAVARGISMPDEMLWVPLGVFRMRNLTTAGSSEGGVAFEIRGYSMEVDIREARFLDTPQAGTTSVDYLGVTSIEDILKKLINDAFPKDDEEAEFVPFNVVSTGYGLSYEFPEGAVLTDERDRLDLIVAFQEDRNVMGYFDRGNYYTIQTLPTALDEPVPFPINTGSDGVLVSFSKEFTRNNVYNAVLAFGEFGGQDDTPEVHVHWLATDDDINSPSRWGGPFGFVPRFMRIGFLPEDSTAALEAVQEAAQASLAKSLDFKSGISFESVPNPLLEPGDVVEIRYEILSMDTPEGELRIEHHLITDITIGLGADTQLSASTIVSSTTLDPETLSITPPIGID